MNTQLVEIASWRIVSELHRRYPYKFKVIETHPGGGQYNCLSLFGEEKHIADFNRGGRLHVFETFNDSRPPEPLEIWTEMFNVDNLKSTLDKISLMIGLAIPSQTPPSTPTTLVYRFISDFLTHNAFGRKHRWVCLNGYLDTSGDSSGVRSFFEKFPQAQKRLKITLTDDILRQPAYRFWFLCRNNTPVLCLETTGIVWNEKGKEFNLADLYLKKRRMWQMVLEVADDLLP